MKKSISFSIIACLFLCLCALTEVNAIQVPVTLTIDEILTESNPYEVNVGDTFDWLVKYDETQIVTYGTDEWLFPYLDPTFDINGAVGTFSFDINDVFAMTLMYPLHFTGGSLDGFYMLYILDLPSYVNYAGGMNQYLLMNADGNELYRGSFVFGAVSPVPEPSTFILLLAGLAGIAGFKIMRRR
ncbi:MAG: PEP-CTERM sorting domain-containing protein [Candidatus Schekmanbacteria bacterium]|nr:PEP-CTERM sorting domain-containing protein [Candidatus Schekmanbacteria bacterium]